MWVLAHVCLQLSSKLHGLKNEPWAKTISYSVAQRQVPVTTVLFPKTQKEPRRILPGWRRVGGTTSLIFPLLLFSVLLLLLTKEPFGSGALSILPSVGPSQKRRRGGGGRTEDGDEREDDEVEVEGEKKGTGIERGGGRTLFPVRRAPLKSKSTEAEDRQEKECSVFFYPFRITWRVFCPSASVFSLSASYLVWRAPTPMLLLRHNFSEVGNKLERKLNKRARRELSAVLAVRYRKVQQRFHC